MFQTGFGGDDLGGLRQLLIAQRAQEIADEDDVLSASLRHSLFFEEVGALLHGLLGITAKAQVTQSLAPADQLLVKPGRTDDADLPLDG